MREGNGTCRLALPMLGFYQDLAPNHRARLTQNWLTDHVQESENSDSIEASARAEMKKFQQHVMPRAIDRWIRRMKIVAKMKEE